VGVMFLYAGLIRIIIGPDDQSFADGERFLITAREFRELTGLAEGIAIRQTQVVTVVVAFIVMGALFWFLQKTRSGKAMRAYSDNEDLALLSGINPDRVVMIAWIITASWPPSPAPCTASTRPTSRSFSCRCCCRSSRRRSSVASASR
jgi:branched-chain amino acid transport system permease protein